jgi:DNA-binding PadR family transcriptional regulator
VHGFDGRRGSDVADRIRQTTSGAFDVGPGSLFPALHRLEQHGFVRGEWTQSADPERGAGDAAHAARADALEVLRAG